MTLTWGGAALDVPPWVWSRLRGDLFPEDEIPTPRFESDEWVTLETPRYLPRRVLAQEGDIVTTQRPTGYIARHSARDLRRVTLEEAKQIAGIEATPKTGGTARG